ncbi:MAG: helix-turn-helix transcriptional regulator [Steroidobacteraceae bacterium]|nr:helix-turn-helix transcriptional regulator [Steroidobacteraceae bacterium]
MPARATAPAPAWALTGLARLPVARPALEFVLDRIPDGMVVVDAVARVLHANRPARELLGRVRAVPGATGALAFADRSTQLAFERALAACDATGAADEDEDESPPARHFLVRDARGNPVARASVEPLQRTHGGAGHGGACLVTLHPRPDEAEVCPDALRALYGLTPAEARIAALAIGTASVDALAQRAGSSRNTVKTHLKGVFRKCEVTSLGQLAALVATGPRRR